jgi:hypothetical protein
MKELPEYFVEHHKIAVMFPNIIILILQTLFLLACCRHKSTHRKINHTTNVILYRAITSFILYFDVKHIKKLCQVELMISRGEKSYKSYDSTLKIKLKILYNAYPETFSFRNTPQPQMG